MDIFAAVSDGDLSRVRELLASNPELANAYDGGSTPLHIAAEKGYGSITESLISCGADVRAENKDGIMPLHLAASEGHHNVVELLVHSGAAVNARVSRGSIQGATPLHTAAFAGYSKVLKCLLQNGADVDARTADGYTALHAAVISDDKEAAKLLIASGADVNARDAKNLETTTPLALVRKGSNEMAELLRAHGGKQPTMLPLVKAGCGVWIALGVVVLVCAVLCLGIH